MDDGDPHDVDIESKGNGSLDIYDDAPIIAYLQVGEILIGLTPQGEGLCYAYGQMVQMGW